MSAARRFYTLETAHIEIYGRMGTLVAKMKNISTSGAFLELTSGEYIPQEGDFVHVSINLSSVGKMRSFNGQVVWSRGLGFGIQFVRKEQLLEMMMQKSSF